MDGRTKRALAKREARREQILEGAQKVFATKGYHGASIKDVLETAGISRGTFYLYFESKDAVFRELLEGFVQQLIDTVEVIDPRSEEPTGQLVENIRRAIDLFVDNPHLTVVLLREAVGLGAETDRELNRLHSFWHEMFVGALENGARWGITREVNAGVAATAIIGSLKEVLYQYLVVDQIDVADRWALAASIVDVWLRGLLPTDSSPPDDDKTGQ